MKHYNVSYIRVLVVRKLLLKPMKATTVNNGQVVKWATQFSRLANEVAVCFFSSPLFMAATAEILHKHKLSCNLNGCLILLFIFVQLSRKWKMAIETKIIFVAGCAFNICGVILELMTVWGTLDFHTCGLASCFSTGDGCF